MLSLACSSTKPLKTVDQVDIQSYSGKWYEIARLPNRFEEGLKCVSATYEVIDNRKIRVINRGINIDDTSDISQSIGKARIPNPNEPAKLKVSFFWPFSGSYWIIELDDDYQYALVGEPKRNYLWILSRKPELSPAVYNKLVTRAKADGFPVDDLIKTVQDCSN